MSIIRSATLDIGGVIYSDDVFKRAIFSALKEMVESVDLDVFEDIYREHLQSQSGSLRNKLAHRFLGGLEHRSRLLELTDHHWRFQKEDLYEDVLPFLELMRSREVRLGIVANQPKTVIDSLQAHGLVSYFEFLGISAIVGLEKPDKKLYQLAFKNLGAKTGEILHIGNRLDNDVKPAKTAGFLTAWVMRGESKVNPSEDEKGQADIAILNLDELGTALLDEENGYKLGSR